MIYYIVGITEKHDETVLSSWDNADAATRALHRYRETTQMLMIYLDYRIDTVATSKEEVDALNARIPADPNKLLANRRAGKNTRIAELKQKLNDQYGKYGDTDSMRTRDFTIDELFPQGTHAVAYTLTCSECACEVKNVLNPYLIKHTDWHNKLLP